MCFLRRGICTSRDCIACLSLLAQSCCSRWEFSILVIWYFPGFYCKGRKCAYLHFRCFVVPPPSNSPLTRAASSPLSSCLSTHQTQRQNCFHTGSSGIPGGISKGPESFILPVTTEWRVELFVYWESTLKTTTECLIFNMAMRFGYGGGCQSLAARVTGCCLSDLA